MKKLLIALAVATTTLLPFSAAAQMNVQQGGTGLNSVGITQILYGQGTSLPGALRLGSNSSFTYSTSTSKLTTPYASTTALTISGMGFLAGLTLTGITGTANNCLQADTNGVVSGSGSSCGGTGSPFPFTPAVGYNATSTAIGFLAGLFSNSSTTLNGSIRFPGLSDGGLGVNSGLVYSGATTTAGTGLTYAAGAFNVNTTQNIAILSNLTSNGYVKTSGSNGTLSVQAVPIPLADGGTNATSFTTSGNSVYYDGTRLVTAPTTGPVTTPYASSTASSDSAATYVPSLAACPAGATSGFSSVCLDTTTFQVQVSSSTVANGYPIVVPSFQAGSVGYGTTTAWAGTTTPPVGLGVAAANEVWKYAWCWTDTGTVQVSFLNGTSRMNFINASTTIGTTTLTTNNQVAQGVKRSVEFGTPASTPTNVSCTIQKDYVPN